MIHVLAGAGASSRSVVAPGNGDSRIDQPSCKWAKYLSVRNADDLCSLAGSVLISAIPYHQNNSFSHSHLLSSGYSKDWKNQMRIDCLKGKSAIVTGGRRGIGKAIAMAFASAGADLTVCDISVDDGGLFETAEQIKGRGGRCLALQTDVSKRIDVETMAKAAATTFGRIDILVNCAGVWVPGENLIECSEENWDKVINTNLKGCYLCCQAVGKIMTAQKNGSIVNISSQVGLTPGAGAGAYPTSKAGIIMLTRQLALELAEFGIRVNALAPGIVKTDFNSEFWRDPAVEKQAAGMVPLNRLAEPKDIAEAALFLASDSSDYITGEVLAVNGGWRPQSSIGSR
jgi:NAD(P)-dependent dehydrogenase (short-subunit alcohol dehydrogenase family)